MARINGNSRLRNALAALTLAASVTVVLGHTYRLDDTGEFIVDDSKGVRRLVVSRGSQFSVSVIDNSGCTADIRASKGKKSIVSVANPKSPGFVANHKFQFTARKAGTTTYDLTVRGEAFNGGQSHCDENSHNPLEITVVDPGGDDRFFASVVRPEIRSLKQALKQGQADLRSLYGVILGDFVAGRLSFILAMQQIAAAFNLAYFQQGDLVRSLINTSRDQARETLLADPVLALLGVPNGLKRGGCGAWDSFVEVANNLLSSARDRSRSDTKKMLGRLINIYSGLGGIAEFTYWIDCDDCYDCDGVSFGLDDYVPKPSARIGNILSVAYTDPGSKDVKRNVFVGAKARGEGFTNVDIALLGDMGEVARTSQVLIEARFTSTLTLPDNSLGVEFRALAESTDVTLGGRGQRFQAANLFTGSSIVSDF